MDTLIYVIPIAIQPKSGDCPIKAQIPQNKNNVAITIINLLSDVLFVGNKTFNNKPKTKPNAKHAIFSNIGKPILLNEAPPFADSSP